MSSPDSPSLWAVVPAAGVGRRYGADLPKQYLPLLGETVLEHGLARLLALPELRRLVLVVAPEDRHWQSLPRCRDPRIQVVTGGSERADSVAAGVEALAERADDEDWVLVHDAARPCVPVNDLRRLLAELAGDPVGGMLAAAIDDTVKQATRGRVETTLDRSRIWRALTPQMFRLAPLRQALEVARRQAGAITDESSALEALGHRPRLIAGSADNIKITRPGDLELAAFYLRRQGEHAGLQPEGEEE